MMQRPTFKNLDEDQPAACNNVCDYVDAGKWEDALLTLNGDANCGLEYPENEEYYAKAKTYFLAKAEETGFNLEALYADYTPPR